MYLGLILKESLQICDPNPKECILCYIYYGLSRMKPMLLGIGRGYLSRNYVHFFFDDAATRTICIQYFQILEAANVSPSAPRSCCSLAFELLARCNDQAHRSPADSAAKSESNGAGAEQKPGSPCHWTQRRATDPRPGKSTDLRGLKLFQETHFLILLILFTYPASK